MKNAANAYANTSKEIQKLSKEAALTAAELIKAEAEYANNGGTYSGGGSSGGSSGTSAAKQAEKDAKEAEKIREEAYRKELRDLEHQKKMCYITETEYYQSLEKLRDKHCEEGSEEWQRLSEDISSYMQKTKEDMVDKWSDAFDEIEDERKSFADSLKSDNKAYRTLTFHSGDSSESFVDLADVAADNAVLQKYSEMLDKLTEKTGDIPEHVREQLLGLSADEAVKYLDAVLKKSDAELAKYIDDINKNTEWSDNISDKLYADEFENLAESFGNEFESEFEELKKAFTDEFGELPEDFFSIGEDSGAEFTKGFLWEYKQLMEDIQSEINAMLSVRIPSASFADVASQSSSITNNYHDNRSTTINAPGLSPRDIIEAEKHRDTYLKHTAKWGD